jgi:hypothetical protein
MQHKITRRSLAGVVAGASLLAQSPAVPPIPSTPEEELTAARNGLKANADQLAKVPLPMSTEPAAHFKA